MLLEYHGISCFCVWKNYKQLAPQLFHGGYKNQAVFLSPLDHCRGKSQSIGILEIGHFTKRSGVASRAVVPPTRWTTGYCHHVALVCAGLLGRGALWEPLWAVLLAKYLSSGGGQGFLPVSCAWLPSAWSECTTDLKKLSSALCADVPLSTQEAAKWELLLASIFLFLPLRKKLGTEIRMRFCSPKE